jgi:ankyrin repeat protein
MADDVAGGGADTAKKLSDDAKNVYNSARLHAAENGHGDVVKALLARGADVGAKDTDGHTPLVHAVVPRAPDIVEVLLAHGPDISDDDASQSHRQRRGVVLAVSPECGRLSRWSHKR